ncbi:alpha/beta hydrolase [Streptomyces bohaiensis]|uniref:Alpha/beta hydrolase n=1 Tax=Streptomyces bohaiensis TaxID=1431344 RepID=A0ABX1CC97_9ACTN|nr:alpha/beta hydrolase [Streptomyces bohaiensis]NJQ16725.1 alpha/beta hydrolase [Streptomyces bohaiensis]
MALALTLLTPGTATAAASTPTAPGRPPATTDAPLGTQGARSPGGEALRDANAAAWAAGSAAEQPQWGRCPAGDRLPPPVECATVDVPLDYADPGGDRLALHLSRLPRPGTESGRAGADGHRTLVLHPGGPGADGRRMPLRPLEHPERVWRDLHAEFDLVGYAPRGVGPSGGLSCAPPESFRAGPTGSPVHPTPSQEAALHADAARYAAGCLAGAPDLLPTLTSADNARDLEVLRGALGQDRLDYLGMSYGSYVGAVHASRFPGSVGATVLDSLVHPGEDRVWYAGNLAQSAAFQQRWEEFLAWVARHDRAYGLGATAAQVAVEAGRALTAAGEAGLGPGSRVGAGELHRAFRGAVYDEAVWPRIARALSEFTDGRTEPLRALAHPDPREAAARENAAAVYAAVQCNDAPWPRDPRQWRRDLRALTERAPFAAWENARENLPCAHWPLPHGTPPVVGAEAGALPPVLLVHGTRDAPTPYEGALETRRLLPGSVLVTEEGGGRHGVTGGNSCVDRLVAAHLLRGEQPSPRQARCEARPEPRP